MRLRPECPWRTRKQMIIHEPSVQHWNLLFAPLPATKRAFHRLSNQWINCVMDSEDSSRNFPEMNRYRLLDVLSVNDDEDESLCWKPRTRRECFPGSMSIQFLLSKGMILDEEPADSLLCGFVAFAFDFTFTCNAYSSTHLQDFLCRCCSNPSQIYLIHEKFWPKNEYCLCSNT